MRISRTSVVFAAMAVVAAGCATTENTTNNNTEQRSELVYRTGSNIPIRDSRPLTKEEKERQAAESQSTFEQFRQAGGGLPGK